MIFYIGIVAYIFRDVKEKHISICLENVLVMKVIYLLDVSKYYVFLVQNPWWYLLYSTCHFPKVGLENNVYCIFIYLFYKFVQFLSTEKVIYSQNIAIYFSW